jgi:anti-sigma factor RsiW
MSDEPRTDDPVLDEDLLSAYLDDELDATARAAVDVRIRESPEWRAILDDVRSARDAVRSLPTREAPPGFWDHVTGLLAADDEAPVADARAAVVSLDERRWLKSPRARLGAMAGAAAACVILAVGVIPGQAENRPPVARFADAHAARSSLTNDAVSQLAGIGKTAGIKP